MAAKALVTGAGGFIGSHVVRQLLRDGQEVRAALAPGEAPTNLQGLAVETVEVDVTNPEQVDQAVQGCSSIYHLAAMYVLYAKDPGRIYEVNVGGTQNVMEAAKTHQIRKVVHTSSIAAVGLKEGGVPADETTPFVDYDLADHYVLSKHRSEQLALQYARDGLPVVVVNPGFPFGPGDLKPTPTGRMILDLIKNRLPGFPAGGLSAVDVEDVARGHLLAAKKGRVGERYLLTGTNMTYRDFLKEAARVAGVRAPRFQIPTPLARVMSHGFLLGTKLFGVDPLMTPELLTYVSRPLYYDNRKAREELGMEFTPLEVTLTKAVDYFRNR